jgi:hypothetical protein
LSKGEDGGLKPVPTLGPGPPKNPRQDILEDRSNYRNNQSMKTVYTPRFGICRTLMSISISTAEAEKLCPYLRDIETDMDVCISMSRLCKIVQESSWFAIFDVDFRDKVEGCVSSISHINFCACLRKGTANE